MDPDQSKADDSFEKDKLLLEEGRIAFDRFFHGSINQILGKIFTLFQVFLLIVTLQLTILGWVGLKISSLSILNYIIFLANIAIIILTFIVFYELVIPQHYGQVRIFEEERLKYLHGLNKRQLVEDFLKETRQAHFKNVAIFTYLVKNYKKSLGLIILDLILFMVFIISLLS